MMEDTGQPESGRVLTGILWTVCLKRVTSVTPRRKTKSVSVSEEGKAKAEGLSKKYFESSQVSLVKADVFGHPCLEVA